MTGLPDIKRNVVIVLLAALVIAGFVVVRFTPWFDGRTTRSTSKYYFEDYPQLFDDVRTCPQRGDAFENGRRSEELGLLRADRYAYHARDGVRAVQHYQEAEACYRAAAVNSDASRVRFAMRVLTARVNTDYAAARLNLVNALEQERWPAALSEIHRLLLLTQHLGRHEYVEWLKEIIGRVAARASMAS